MAKLSAHGQELMRLEKVNQVSDGTLSPVYKDSDGTESPSLTTWDRTTRAYMADGVILEKTMSVSVLTDSTPRVGFIPMAGRNQVA